MLAEMLAENHFIDLGEIKTLIKSVVRGEMTRMPPCEKLGPKTNQQKLTSFVARDQNGTKLSI